jgi:hypothetical protein
VPEHVPIVTGEILPHPALLKLYHREDGGPGGVAQRRQDSHQAAETMAWLINSFTIHPGPKSEAEVVAELGKLVRFAINDNGKRDGQGSFVSVVAGVGFEPTTFRL